MPLYELRAMLAENGDRILGPADVRFVGPTMENAPVGHEVITSKGYIYVASHEGLEFRNNEWWPKVRWSRKY